MRAQVKRTRWGGIADGAMAGGYFRVERRDGVWWLIDPDGGRFLSKGVNTVKFDQDETKGTKRVPYAEACRRKYGSEAKWRKAAAARLVGWGFNTLGSWSDVEVAAVGVPLAVTPNVDLAMSFAWERQQPFPDVFDPAFETYISRRAQELCAPHRGEKHILAWFIDNELRWGADWRGTVDLYDLFRDMPPDSFGHRAAKHAVRERFIADVADRYFALTTAAIRKADPNHLVAGCRFALVPSASIIEAAGRHADIVSFNCYELDASAAIATYAHARKPCLIGEFSFRAADSGLPNTNGAGPKVETQRERADCFRRYVTAAFNAPTIVGCHWFEHADQPAEGRFDGENSNFGTVTIGDDVYDDLTRAMTAVNADAETTHAAAAAMS